MTQRLSDYLISSRCLDVEAGLSRLAELDFSNRLANRDRSLWPTGERGGGMGPDRTGWIQAPHRAAQALEEWKAVAQRISAYNPGKIFLMGMGGSSLFSGALSSLQAPKRKNGRELVLVDNFFPATISPLMDSFADPGNLIVVASKSGSTLETSVMASMAESVGAAPRMVAITDPATPLERRAKDLGYAAIIHGFPDVGGRFSALTPFGLFPALLLDDPVEEIITSAEEMMRRCTDDIPIEENPGAVLGSILAAMWRAGDLIFDVMSPPGCGAFNAWVEQLVSESLGKEGVGLWPRCRWNDQRRDFWPEAQGAGVLGFGGDGEEQRRSFTWSVDGVGAIGAEAVRWEVAIAAAALLMNIPPFTEPDVLVAKELTRDAAERLARGEGQRWSDGLVREGSWSAALSDGFAPPLARSFRGFMAEVAENKKALSCLVYLPRNTSSLGALYGMADELESRYEIPVLLGFGPQYLHATGQLHKGGSDGAFYLVLTYDPVESENLPDHNGVGLGALAIAQGLADVQALIARGRRVLHLHFHGPYSEALEKLGDLI